MDLTIGSFKARLDSLDESPVLGALRKLRRLADLTPTAGVVVEPASEWPVWAVVEDEMNGAPAFCHT